MIDFAGVGLAAPNSDLQAILADWWDPGRPDPFSPAGWTDRPQVLQFPHPYPPKLTTEPPKLGRLSWPTGASRWATFWHLVTQSQLEQIRTAIGSTPAAKTLTLSDGTRSITPSLWMLPPRPVARLGSQELFLITLVDERYWWWQAGDQSPSSSTYASWSALFSDLFGKVGVSSPTIETIPSAYSTPSIRWNLGPCPIPLLLDAAAMLTGSRVVRALDGSVRTVRAATAVADTQTEYTSRLADRLSGGLIETADIALAVPEKVAVIFYDATTPVTTTRTLTACSLTEYGSAAGVTGRVGTVWADMPATASSGNRSSLADEAAKDWYRWALANVEATYRGVVDWDFGGAEDSVEWEADYLGGADGPHLLTRVNRPPFNGMDLLGSNPASGGSSSVTTALLCEVTVASGSLHTVKRKTLNTFSGNVEDYSPTTTYTQCRSTTQLLASSSAILLPVGTIVWLDPIADKTGYYWITPAQDAGNNFTNSGGLLNNLAQNIYGDKTFKNNVVVEGTGTVNGETSLNNSTTDPRTGLYTWKTKLLGDKVYIFAYGSSALGWSHYDRWTTNLEALVAARMVIDGPIQSQRYWSGVLGSTGLQDVTVSLDAGVPTYNTSTGVLTWAIPTTAYTRGGFAIFYRSSNTSPYYDPATQPSGQATYGIVNDAAGSDIGGVARSFLHAFKGVLDTDTSYRIRGTNGGFLGQASGSGVADALYVQGGLVLSSSLGAGDIPFGGYTLSGWDRLRSPYNASSTPVGGQILFWRAQNASGGATPYNKPQWTAAPGGSNYILSASGSSPDFIPTWIDPSTLPSGTVSGTTPTSGTGIMCGDGSTVRFRTLTAPAAGITVSNGTGASGNPTLALADDLAALEAMSGTGLVARTAANTYAQRTLTGPAAGITVSNGDGVSGNPTLALADDLAALEAISSSGIPCRTGLNTWSPRTIVSADGSVSITNPGGVGGNIDLSVSSSPIASMIPGGRLTLSSSSPIADVTGGGTLYYLPYLHTKVKVYTGSAWKVLDIGSSGISIAITGTNLNIYDIFLYDNSGTPALEIGTLWTNDASRSVALSQQNGVLVKSGDATRTYLGTIFISSSSNIVNDDVGSRCVFNMYNRVDRRMFIQDLTSHSYTTAAWRKWRGGTTTDLYCVLGDPFAGDMPIFTSSSDCYAAGFAGVGYLQVATNNFPAYDCQQLGTGRAMGSRINFPTFGAFRPFLGQFGTTGATYAQGNLYGKIRV